jgi:hypothetical protein
MGEAERLSGGPIHKVILLPYDFSFADGTKWLNGDYETPEPPPAMWKVADPSQF